jgi:hypothetical protein
MDPFRRVVSDRNHRELKNGLKLNRPDLVITAPCISVGLATRGSSRAGRDQPTGATETNTDTRFVSCRIFEASLCQAVVWARWAESLARLPETVVSWLLGPRSDLSEAPVFQDSSRQRGPYIIA